MVCLLERPFSTCLVIYKLPLSLHRESKQDPVTIPYTLVDNFGNSVDSTVTFTIKDAVDTVSPNITIPDKVVDEGLFNALNPILTLDNPSHLTLLISKRMIILWSIPLLMLSLPKVYQDQRSVACLTDYLSETASLRTFL